jgi:hypothetical protein
MRGDLFSLGERLFIHGLDGSVEERREFGRGSSVLPGKRFLALLGIPGEDELARGFCPFWTGGSLRHGSCSSEPIGLVAAFNAFGDL